VIAERLADLALAKTYGEAPDREVLAPAYASHRVEGREIIVTFKHVGTGLKTDDGKAPNWFEISAGAPADTNECAPLTYVKADAKIIDPNTIRVGSANLTDPPKHVRLGWHALARHNLYNSAGLPAVNFRTDARPTKRR
jgi:sialate O-acetylesterase